MRIATWNINDIRKRLSLLLAWLDATAPDIVALQELKCSQDAFPAAKIREAGYEALWVGQPSWNGVALLSRIGEPIEIRRTLPGDPDDSQARYLEAAIHGHIVACLYLPNGNPCPGPKFDYKMRWFDRLLGHAQTLKDSKLPVVLAGDFNVVPTDADIYKPDTWRDNALLQPEARERFADLTSQGWMDCLRRQHPKDKLFTFWDYRRNRWQRDAGLRIDHILLSKPLQRKVEACGVDRAMRGIEGASDHAPVWIELRT
jgi:exodeoxyribonuclease III